MKALFDPRHRMNPGKVVAPHPLDGNLRLGAGWRPMEPTGFTYPRDGNRFSDAVLRCVGIGNCRTGAGGVMCPSYRATREEEHSTRGRARLLFEMLNGHPDSAVTDGWHSTAVRDALDLCLACKGCRSDCPVGVDMATYKAEFLPHHYAGRPRPVTHYSLGYLPLWAVLVRRAPRVVNALLRAPLLAPLGKRLAGVAAQRELPPFAPQTLVVAAPRARGARSVRRPDRGAVTRHVHQPLPAARGAGGRRGAGRRQVGGGRTGHGDVLWPDVDLHQPSPAQSCGCAASRRADN